MLVSIVLILSYREDGIMGMFMKSGLRGINNTSVLFLTLCDIVAAKYIIIVPVEEIFF